MPARVADAGLCRAPGAKAEGQAQHGRAGCSGGLGGRIRTGIIDDEHCAAERALHPLDDGADGRSLIARRHDGEAGAGVGRIGNDGGHGRGQRKGPAFSVSGGARVNERSGSGKWDRLHKASQSPNRDEMIRTVRSAAGRAL